MNSNLHSSPFALCDTTRRAFCERWAKTALGVSVLHGTAAKVLSAGTTPVNATTGPGFGKADKIIFLQMIGGMTHIDTLDPKEGPTQGPVKPISTKAGFQLGGTMENLAKHSDKFTIIRSMSSKTGVHASGQYLIRSGYEQRGTIKHPNLGAWAQHFKGPSHKTLPSSVCVNRQPQNGNGFFPASFSPLPILDPEAGLQYSRSDVDAGVMEKRIAMLNKLDAGFRERFQTASVKDYTQFYEKTVSRVLVYKKIAERELQLHVFDPDGLKAGDKRACYPHHPRRRLDRWCAAPHVSLCRALREARPRRHQHVVSPPQREDRC
jgi:hypothetical protein